VTQPLDALVFDTGPLRHFAGQSWLGVLKFLAGDRDVIIPESVERELKKQSHDLPVLHQVLDADWISVDRSDDMPFLMAFAEYEHRLAVGEQNRGECGVLALGRSRGFETVLDDSVPRTIAEEDGIRVTATLPLLCNAIRGGQLTVLMVEALADDLLSGAYYLPFGPGGFRQWAHEEGLIEYE
jgi:predicted nucleic acid-binding protein